MFILYLPLYPYSEYGFSTDGYRNPSTTTQWISYVIYAASTPLAGIAYFVVFLIMQPQALAKLKEIRSCKKPAPTETNGLPTNAITVKYNETVNDSVNNSESEVADVDLSDKRISGTDSRQGQSYEDDDEESHNSFGSSSNKYSTKSELEMTESDVSSEVTHSSNSLSRSTKTSRLTNNYLNDNSYSIDRTKSKSTAVILNAIIEDSSGYDSDSPEDKHALLHMTDEQLEFKINAYHVRSISSAKSATLSSRNASKSDSSHLSKPFVVNPILADGSYSAANFIP